jgi:hypothetical protein
MPALSSILFPNQFSQYGSLPGRAIGPSKGLYLQGTAQHRKTKDKHPMPYAGIRKRDSAYERSRPTPQTRYHRFGVIPINTNTNPSMFINHYLHILITMVRVSSFPQPHFFHKSLTSNNAVLPFAGVSKHVTPANGEAASHILYLPLFITLFTFF